MEKFIEFYEKCVGTFQSPTVSNLKGLQSYVQRQKFQLDSKHENMLVDSYLMKVKAFMTPLEDSKPDEVLLPIIGILHELLSKIQILITHQPIDFLNAIIAFDKSKDKWSSELVEEILHCLCLIFNKFDAELFQTIIGDETLTRYAVFISFAIKVSSGIRDQTPGLIKEQRLSTLALEFILVFYTKVVGVKDSKSNLSIVKYVALTMPQVISAPAILIRIYAVVNGFTFPDYPVILTCLKILKTVFTFIFDIDFKSLTSTSENQSKKMKDITLDSVKLDDEWLNTCLPNVGIVLNFIADYLILSPSPEVQDSLLDFSLSLSELTCKEFNEKFFQTFLRVIFRTLNIQKIKNNGERLQNLKNSQFFGSFVEDEIHKIFEDLPAMFAGTEKDSLDRLQNLWNLIHFMSRQEFHIFLQNSESLKQLFRMFVKAFQFKKTSFHSSEFTFKEFVNLRTDSFSMFKRFLEDICDKSDSQCFYLVVEHFQELLDYSNMNPSVVYVFSQILKHVSFVDGDILQTLVTKCQERFDEFDDEVLKQTLILELISNCYERLFQIDCPRFKQRFFQKSYSLFVQVSSSPGDSIRKEKAQTFLENIAIRFKNPYPSVEVSPSPVSDMVFDNFDYITSSLLITLNTSLIFQLDSNSIEEFQNNLIKTTNTLNHVLNTVSGSQRRLPKKHVEILNVCMDRLLDLLNLGSIKSSSNLFLPHFGRAFQLYLNMIQSLFCDTREEKKIPRAEDKHDDLDPKLFPQTEDEWKYFRCEYRQKYLNSSIIRSRTGEIFHFAINLLADSSVLVHGQYLDICSKAIQILSDYEDILLPYLYKFSKPLPSCFERKEILIWKKGFEICVLISRVSGDFLRKPIQNNVVPKLLEFMDDRIKYLENYKQKHGREYESMNSIIILFLKELCINFQELAKNLSFDEAEVRRIEETVFKCNNLLGRQLN